MPPTFRAKRSGTRHEREREHDQRRGSARERGYDRRWDVNARAYREAHPLCLGCEALGDVRATEICDHIIPHKGDTKLFTDPKNRQPACGWHHDVVKQQLERMYEQGIITAQDLRLDSVVAVALTRKLLNQQAPGGVR